LLKQARLPSCGKVLAGAENLCTSDEEDGDDLRCPHSDCRAMKGRWNKRDHLLRHYKKRKFINGRSSKYSACPNSIIDASCEVVCACGQGLDSVDQFDKHVASCRLLRDVKHEDERLQFQALKKRLHREALQDMNQQLARNQKKNGDTHEVIIKEQRQDSIDITREIVECQGIFAFFLFFPRSSLTAYES
jgi:hypothetical protein